MKLQQLFLGFALLIGLFFLNIRSIFSQTLGGNAAYNFLQLPNTPQLSALGAINISNISSDAGLAFNNPSLLRTEMQDQFHISFNSMYAGIKNYHAMYTVRQEKWKTNLAIGVHFLDYGNIPETDAAGNVYGSFRPNDYVTQISFSRAYAGHWHYGATLKFIHSSYGVYRSAAMAMDMGISYYDSSRFFQVSFLAKNMGVQIKQYPNSRPDDLPFDVEIGITKKLKNAPLQFSLTVHHLQQYLIRYNDTSFNTSNGIAQNTHGLSSTIDNIFRHFVLAGQWYIGSRIELTMGYNYLLRKELIISNSSNGLTGFSLGVGVLFKKFQIRYAHSLYQNNTGYQQFGLNLPLSSF